MSEVGTLKELDVKPGDMVEYWYFNRTWVKGRIDENCVAQMENGLDQDKKNSTDPNWRIISRATPTPKLWRDMTDAEKGALLLAYHDGKVIEFHNVYSGKWQATSLPVWRSELTYRVRPEPKVETVKTHGTWSPKGQMPKSSYVYEIEFETVDGHPKWNTAKVTGK